MMDLNLYFYKIAKSNTTYTAVECDPVQTIKGAKRFFLGKSGLILCCVSGCQEKKDLSFQEDDFTDHIQKEQQPHQSEI